MLKGSINIKGIKAKHFSLVFLNKIFQLKPTFMTTEEISSRDDREFRKRKEGREVWG